MKVLQIISLVIFFVCGWKGILLVINDDEFSDYFKHFTSDGSVFTRELKRNSFGADLGSMDCIETKQMVQIWGLTLISVAISVVWLTSLTDRNAVKKGFLSLICLSIPSALGLSQAVFLQIFFLQTLSSFILLFGVSLTVSLVALIIPSSKREQTSRQTPGFSISRLVDAIDVVFFISQLVLGYSLITTPERLLPFLFFNQRCLMMNYFSRLIGSILVGTSFVQALAIGSNNWEWRVYVHRAGFFSNIVYIAYCVWEITQSTFEMGGLLTLSAIPLLSCVVHVIALSWIPSYPAIQTNEEKKKQ